MPDGVSAYVLEPGKTCRVGRGTQNDIVIPHDPVSRDHALIYGGAVPEVEDLGSRNGTRVNGQRLEPRTRMALESGASIQIGDATLFVHCGPFAIDRARGSGLNEIPEAGVATPSGVLSSELVFKDERMIALYQTAETVASGEISVLILGETGVGKELLAQAIHSLSPRRSSPFVKVNSAALPEQLVESELFGYERGAFTGADKSKPGLFEAADGGTLFLDEVGDLPLAAQAKLLRVLETGEIARLGAVKPKKVNVRFISATNRDLRALISAGNFRKDLLYRLNGVSLHIPRLRDRPLDIAALVEFFASRSAGKAGHVTPRFTAEAMTRLSNYRWPGNVRELKNVVERAALLARGGPVTAEALHLDPPADPRPSPGPLAIAPIHRQLSPSLSVPPEFGPEAETRLISKPSFEKDGELVGKLRSELAIQERRRILEALARANGNQTVAAEILSVSRRTLLNWLDAHAIPRPRKGRVRR
jgi:two-component system response regulator AtoC